MTAATVPTPSTTNAASDLITCAEAAQIANVSVQCLRNWCTGGGFSVRRIPRARVGLRRGPTVVDAIIRAEFLDFLARRGIVPTGDKYAVTLQKTRNARTRKGRDHAAASQRQRSKIRNQKNHSRTKSAR